MLLSILKQQMDFLESQMAERCGMKLYKSANGFTQEEIYAYAGAKDCVATLTLSQHLCIIKKRELLLKKTKQLLMI